MLLTKAPSYFFMLCLHLTPPAVTRNISAKFQSTVAALTLPVRARHLSSCHLSNAGALSLSLQLSLRVRRISAQSAVDVAAFHTARPCGARKDSDSCLHTHTLTRSCQFRTRVFRPVSPCSGVSDYWKIGKILSSFRSEQGTPRMFVVCRSQEETLCFFLVAVVSGIKRSRK